MSSFSSYLVQLPSLVTMQHQFLTFPSCIAAVSLCPTPILGFLYSYIDLFFESLTWCVFLSLAVVTSLGLAYRTKIT